MYRNSINCQENIFFKVDIEMLYIKARIPTKNLPIKKVLAKLFQSFVYSCLDDKEHKGYKHFNGKVFKSMNFKITYRDYDLEIKYTALDKENEKKVAQKILLDGLKLGDIHITSTEISLQQRSVNYEAEMLHVKGFIAAAIKDGKSNKKIYLEPKSHKFQEIITNNTLQKYEALYGKTYMGNFKVEVLNQQLKERIFFYNKGIIKAWNATYKIKADKDIQELILNTGVGAHTMQGLGFVEVL